jgi:hypothetical protein
MQASMVRLQGISQTHQLRESQTTYEPSPKAGLADGDLCNISAY